MIIKKAIALICVCVSISVLLSACANDTIKNVIEGLIDAENESVEKTNKKDKEEEEEEEKEEREEESNLDDIVPLGEYTVIEWPDWVPRSIPKYKYGDLWNAQNYDDSGQLYLTNINLKKDPFNAYVKELIGKGWEEDEGWTEPDDENHYAIHMIHEEGNLFLTYNVIIDEKEIYGSINYDDYTSPSSDNGEAGDEQYTFEIEEQDGVSGVVGNESIPEGYPHDFCPIYKGADILQAQELADAEMSMYIIALLSKDDIDKVADFYNNNANVSVTLGDYAIGLESADGKITAQIQITEAEAEHANQGYKSFIMISAIVEK